MTTKTCISVGETLRTQINKSGILNHTPEGRHTLVKYASHYAEKFPYFTDQLVELLKVETIRASFYLGPLELPKYAVGAAGMLKQSIYLPCA